MFISNITETRQKESADSGCFDQVMKGSIRTRLVPTVETSLSFLKAHSPVLR